MNRFLARLGLVLTAVVCLLLSIAVLTSVSPIYDFEAAHQFSGPDIFNPYSSFRDSIGWKKANFHTHTRVEGLLNECRYWPEEMLGDYRRLGYDVLTFSNHNALTVHPEGEDMQVNLYEHGYNICKYHKLVFGCDRVMPFDHLFPFLASQRQWQMDMLAATGSDVLLVMNHPSRTLLTGKTKMECLTGYRIVELDSGRTTEQEYWDWALSAGHYSFGLANDDCHDSRTSRRIARRCSFICTPSAREDDLHGALLSGCFFSMRIPDYGDGNWDEKVRRNLSLPKLRNVSVADSLISVSFSERADRIVAIGQDHAVLSEWEDTDSVSMVLGEGEPYVRLTAYMPDSVVIYTNPFARYDSSASDCPYVATAHPVDVPLTVLFNMLVLALAALLAYAAFIASGRARRI